MTDSPVSANVEALPTISVVMIVLNMVTTVRTALESVIGQAYPHLDVVVIDGGSRDGTAEIIEEFADSLDYFFSGPDEGSIHALNHGVQAAKGEVICLLAADDWFEPGAFLAIGREFAEDGGLDVLCMGVRVVRVDGAGTLRNVILVNDEPGLAFTLENLCRYPWTHARIFRKRVYEALGGYDMEYRVTSDVDFLLRAWQAGVRSRVNPLVAYTYLEHRGSQTLSGTPEMHVRIGRDMLKIMEGHIESGSVRPPEAGILVEMHGRCGIRWCLAEVRLGRIREAIGVFRRMLRLNPLVPVQLLCWLASGLGHRLGRRLSREGPFRPG